MFQLFHTEKMSPHIFMNKKLIKQPHLSLFNLL